MKKNLQKAFSLTELLTALAITGVLASIAYPSYMSHVVETRRADATKTLMEIAQLQERYFSENMTYAHTFRLLMNDLTLPDSTTAKMDSGDGEYEVLMTSTENDGATVCDATPASRCMQFTLAANPKAGSVTQNRDQNCVTFSLDHRGTRAATNNATLDSTLECW